MGLLQSGGFATYHMSERGIEAEVNAEARKEAKLRALAAQKSALSQELERARRQIESREATNSTLRVKTKAIEQQSKMVSREAKRSHEQAAKATKLASEQI